MKMFTLVLTLFIALPTLGGHHEQEGMSANIAVAKAGYDAFNAGDMDAWRAVQAPDSVWTIQVGLPYTGTYIGPAEVENSLLTHPAVQMSAVIGVPDEARGEMVKAYVILKDGQTPSDALAEEIQNHVKTRLAAHEYPRAVAFVDELPMTTTGKIQRKVLREREASS